MDSVLASWGHHRVLGHRFGVWAFRTFASSSHCDRPTDTPALFSAFRNSFTPVRCSVCQDWVGAGSFQNFKFDCLLLLYTAKRLHSTLRRLSFTLWYIGMQYEFGSGPAIAQYSLLSVSAAGEMDGHTERVTKAGVCRSMTSPSLTTRTGGS